MADTTLTKRQRRESSTGHQNSVAEFLSNVSLHCLQWLAKPTISSCEFFLWLTVHAVGIWAIVFILNTAYNNNNINPLVTTLYNTLYPIKSVPFPAISICNNNRMSRRSAEEYVDTLWPKLSNDLRDDAVHTIRQLGKLYDNDLQTAGELTEFQHFFDNYNTNSSDAVDIRKQMQMLSPQCADLLLRCFWRGVEEDCMRNNETFVQRSTQYGFCCTFNYVRPNSLLEGEPESLYIDDTGPELGIILLLNGSRSDYLYPFYNFVGFIIQVFNPNEYPDVPSGSVSERIVDLGYETFIRIDSTTLFTEQDLKRYSASTRGCLFTDDLREQFRGRYKRSDCVVNCRVASIIALCNCRIFYLPIIQLTGSSPTVPIDLIPMCSMEHISCLNRYRIKWSTMVMEYKQIIGLEMEHEDGLMCPECLPSCSDTTYIVSYQNSKLIDSHRSYEHILSGVSNVSDVALVRIFFGQSDTWLYKQSASTQWYQTISNLGGICGVISGFSLMSIAEIVYFLLRQFAAHIRIFISRR